MTEIVDHMRVYSRKVGEAEKKRMAARAPIDGVLGLLRQQLKIHGVDVSVGVEEGMQILGDQVKLEQVFMNLISNAWDAVKDNDSEQGKTIEITAQPGLAAPDGKPLVVFKIKDNGSGVPEHLRHQIFEPFVTGKPRGEGTGLGLSVTKGIVEEHDGTIEVESTSGCGTVFKVSLPAA